MADIKPPNYSKPFSGSLEKEVGALMNSFRKKNELNDSKDIPFFNYHITLLLSIFFGWCGLDRFYVGKIGTGMLKLVTFGGLGLWWIIDSAHLLLKKETDVYGRDLLERDKKEITILFLFALSGVWHYFYLGFNRLGLIRIGILVFSIILYFINMPIAGTLFLAVHVVWTIIDLYLILSGRISRDIHETPINNTGAKYQSLALILAIIGGFLALDRFYLGHRTLALFKLFTLGGYGLWVVVDFILIILNLLKDSNGKPMIQG